MLKIRSFYSHCGGKDTIFLLIKVFLKYSYSSLIKKIPLQILYGFSCDHQGRGGKQMREVLCVNLLYMLSRPQKFIGLLNATRGLPHPPIAVSVLLSTT